MRAEVENVNLKYKKIILNLLENISNVLKT